MTGRGGEMGGAAAAVGHIKMAMHGLSSRPIALWFIGEMMELEEALRHLSPEPAPRDGAREG